MRTLRRTARNQAIRRYFLQHGPVRAYPGSARTQVQSGGSTRTLPRKGVCVFSRASRLTVADDDSAATLTGNLTRDVELRSLPSGTDVARLLVASGTGRRSGDEWVEKTNYFTVEVYGAQANLCADRLGKGSRVVVDGELDWREWTDQEHNRREAVVLRARQILFERTRFDPSRQRASQGSATVRRMASPAPPPRRLRWQARTTCRSDQRPSGPSDPSADGRPARPPAPHGSFFLR